MLGYDWPRLHAALNDLPAALLLAAVLFDLLGALTRRQSFRALGFGTLIAGAVGGVLAVVSGLQAEEHLAHGEAVHQAMETHEELALITLGIFAGVALWRIVRERKMGGAERIAVLVVSLAGTGVLIATAAAGGRLVFEHAAGIPTEVLQSEMHERTEGHHHHGGDGESDEAAEHTDGHAPAAGDSVATDTAVAPASAGHTHAPGTPPHKD
jgi:uncharacterized membrane protein